MKAYHNSVVLKFNDETTGNSGAAATIKVNVSGGGLATIYDLDGDGIGNPFNADSLGNYSFKAANGIYDIIISEGTANEVTLGKVNIDLNAFEKEAITGVNGQTTYVLQTLTVSPATTVWINSGLQHQSLSAYTVDVNANSITLSESPQEGDLIEVWSSPIVVSGPVTAAQGSKENPYTFDSTYSFVNNLPYTYFVAGDWLRTSGRTESSDIQGALYQITETAPTAFRRNYENYIPVNGDGADIGVTLWAVLKEGFKRNFKEQAIEIIAHRSFTRIGVENTALNDSAAINHDIQSMETDMQVTSDDVVVRFHDETVDDTTNGTGTIASKTFAEVRALVLDQVAGTILSDRVKIGTFEDFVIFAKSVGARIYPEIKYYRTLADIQLMVDVIEAHEYESMTIMIGFEIDDIVEVRRINKRIGVAWLANNINTEDEYAAFDKLQKLKYADVSFQEGTLVEFPSLVSVVYDAGLGLVAWGLENNTEMNALLNIGVFRLKIDQPQLIASVRGLQNVNY